MTWLPVLIDYRRLEAKQRMRKEDKYKNIINVITSLLERRITLISGIRSEIACKSTAIDTLLKMFERIKGYTVNSASESKKDAVSLCYPLSFVAFCKIRATEHKTYTASNNSIYSFQKQIISKISEDIFRLCHFLLNIKHRDTAVSISKTGNKFSSVFFQLKNRSFDKRIFKLNISFQTVPDVFSVYFVISKDHFGKISEKLVDPDISQLVEKDFLEHPFEQDQYEESDWEKPVQITNPEDFFFARIFLNEESFPQIEKNQILNVETKKLEAIYADDFRKREGGYLFHYRYSKAIAGSCLYIFNGIIESDLKKPPFRSATITSRGILIHSKRFLRKLLDEEVDISLERHSLFMPEQAKARTNELMIAIDFKVELSEDNRCVNRTDVCVYMSLGVLNQLILKIVGEDRLELLKHNKKNLLLSLLDLNLAVSEMVYLTFSYGEQIWMRGVSPRKSGIFEIDHFANAVMARLTHLDDKSIHYIITASFSNRNIRSHFSTLYQIGPNRFRSIFRGKLSENQIENITEEALLLFTDDLLAQYESSSSEFISELAHLAEDSSNDMPLDLKHILTTYYIKPLTKKSQKEYQKIMQSKTLSNVILRANKIMLKKYLSPIHRKELILALVDEKAEAKQAIAGIYSDSGKKMFLDDSHYTEREIKKKEHFNYTELIMIKRKIENIIKTGTISLEELKKMLSELRSKAYKESKDGSTEKAIEYYYQGIDLFKTKPDTFYLLFYSEILNQLIDIPSRISEAISLGETIRNSDQFKEIKDPFIFKEKDLLCRFDGQRCWAVVGRSKECTAGKPDVYTALAEAYYKNFQYKKAQEAICKTLDILEKHRATGSRQYNNKVNLKKKIEEKLFKVKRALENKAN